MNAKLFVDHVPENFKKIEEGPDHLKGNEAMEEELRSLTKNQSLKLVKRLVGAKVIGKKWVFRLKNNEKEKLKSSSKMKDTTSTKRMHLQPINHC